MLPRTSRNVLCAVIRKPQFATNER
jgi:hypothetical protein